MQKQMRIYLHTYMKLTSRDLTSENMNCMSNDRLCADVAFNISYTQVTSGNLFVFDFRTNVKAGFNRQKTIAQRFQSSISPTIHL